MITMKDISTIAGLSAHLRELQDLEERLASEDAIELVHIGAKPFHTCALIPVSPDRSAQWAAALLPLISAECRHVMAQIEAMGVEPDAV